MKRIPVCHPSSPHEAKGLCYKCYWANYVRQPHNKKKKLEYNNKYRRKHPDKVRAFDRKMAKKHESKRMFRRYGITLDEYNQMSESQNGVCAICGKGNGSHKLAIDHCHSTFRVRGLLCKKCNSAIGMLGDDRNLLLRASEYIHRFIAHAN